MGESSDGGKCSTMPCAFFGTYHRQHQNITRRVRSNTSILSILHSRCRISRRNFCRDILMGLSKTFLLPLMFLFPANNRT